ncbi:GNAT family N-acetyltransferase [Paenibacillus tarimensis]
MYNYREMVIDDYEPVIALWRRIEGLALSEADSRESIQYYLNRNSGLSFVCEHNDRIVGTVLCGHDGRRGYIYHAAVDPEHRGHRIGTGLVARSLKQLRKTGIMKCHIMVIADNELGRQFWGQSGWMKRDGILLYSADV